MEVFLIGCLGGVDLVGAGDLLSLACGVYLVDGKGEAISWKFVCSGAGSDRQPPPAQRRREDPVLAEDSNDELLVVYEAPGRRADLQLAQVADKAIVVCPSCTFEDQELGPVEADGDR